MKFRFGDCTAFREGLLSTDLKMSWFDALGVASSAIRNMLREPANPNKVLDVKSGQYSSRFIHYREETLVLYGPSKERLRTEEKYEIVLHRPCSESLHQAFRLVQVAVM